MSAKRTLEDLENISSSRNHQLISVSIPTYVMSGTITLKCCCGCLFTTSAKSYFNSINGCPDCKKKKASEQWLGTTRRTLSERAQTKVLSRRRRREKMMDESTPYAKIKNRDDLILYLKSNPNAYNDFMIECINREKTTPLIIGDLKGHHIIPLFAGGCAQSWNLTHLTAEEHQKAHQLRYDIYQENGDKMALKFFKGFHPLKEVLEKERRKLGLETQKKQKKGRFSPQQQAASGKIGGTLQTEAKISKYILKQGPVVRKFIEEGSIWVNKENKELVIIKPKAIQLVYEFQSIFASSLPDGEKKTNLLKVERTNFSSAIAKVIKGERKSAYGFSLKQ